ncbi:metal ABC transporter substrate-binding protein, partial [Enemella sp. A6]|uniref:metal ABC transporter substrate-binding protein n=1 Tax=Enemella sp. A6 TaxID=3440152 RepID=UPI003EBBF06E
GDDHADHDHGNEGDDHEGHNHGPEDPHVFLDAGRMATAAELIGAKLTEVTGDDKFTECGKQVSGELKKTDEEVKKTLSAVPADKRVIITDHDAFAYFAKAYDFQVAGVVIPGGSTDGDASSSHLAELVKVIKERNISTIFSNSAVSPKLVESLAAETGRDVKVVELYVGSVGPEGSGAETYSGMMTTNATRIADALK